MSEAPYRSAAENPSREALEAIREQSAAALEHAQAARAAKARRKRRAKLFAVGCTLALVLAAAVLLVLRVTLLRQGWVGLAAMICAISGLVSGIMSVGLRNPPSEGSGDTPMTGEY